MKYLIFIMLSLHIFCLSGCKQTDTGSFIGYAHEISNGKWGFINDKGIEIIPHKFDYARNFCEGLAVVRIGNKYGYINSRGNITIPLQFDKACSFKSGLAKVTRNRYEGMITQDGRLVVPCTYQDIEICHDAGNLKVRQNGKYGYLNFSGDTLIPIKYEEILPFDETETAIAKRDGKYGFVTLSGEEILPCIYTKLREFGSRFYWVTNDSLCGLVDKTSKHFVQPCEYSSFTFCDKQNDTYGGKLIRVEKDKKTGLLNEQGEWLIPLTYDGIGDFDSNQKAIANDKGKFGLINARGEKIIPFQYEEMQTFKDGLYRTRQNNHYGLIDDSLYEILPCTYDAIGQLNKNLYRTAKKELYGVITSKGKTILPCKYKDIYLIGNDLLLVMQEDFSVGLLNSEGIQLTSFNYTQIEPFDSHGRAIVHRKEKKGYIDHRGKEIVPCKYLEVSPISEDGTLQVKIDKGPVIRIKANL